MSDKYQLLEGDNELYGIGGDTWLIYECEFSRDEAELMLEIMNKSDPDTYEDLQAEMEKRGWQFNA